MSATMKKSERFAARMTSHQKALFRRAAAYSGRSLSGFVIESAQAVAEELIRAHEQTRLTPDESMAFAEALLAPTGPNAALREAARRYTSYIAN